MPTKPNLVRRTITNDPLCEPCRAAHETPLHALWTCKELDIVWDTHGSGPIRSQSNFQDFKHLLSTLLQQQSDVEMEAMIIWPVWTQRNQIRLNKPASTLHQIVQQSKDWYNEFRACQVPSKENTTLIRKRWRPPLAETVKINFYGAVFSSENKSGLGVVVRNSSGQVMASCSKLVHQAYDSNEVEASNGSSMGTVFCCRDRHQQCGVGPTWTAIPCWL